MPYSIRAATTDDIVTLRAVIAESARGLRGDDYTAEQIEAALQGAFGVDSELIRDRTYFVVEEAGVIVACGGWSRRRTLFGGDAQPGRQSGPLDPASESARVRAFFVRPAWARHGIGRLLLAHCEREARAAGFRTVELLATLPGRRLYAALGYVGEQRETHTIGDGVAIDFIPMKKQLDHQGPERGGPPSCRV